MNKPYISFFTTIVLSTSISLAQNEWKDVAQIFYNKCSSCHHAGGGAPFTIMSYNDASSWTPQIEYALSNNIMPPWSPDTTYTRFMHERAISQTDKNKILDWITNGGMPGDTTQAPAPPVYTSGSYKLHGTPDLVVKIPAYTSTATSSDIYVCISVPTGLTQDRIVKAYEIVPGDAGIVHHALIGVDSMGTSTNDLSGNCLIPPGDFRLGGYVPGGAPMIFPNQGAVKGGMKLNAGSKLSFQIHYPAGSVGKVDSMQVRLYFYPLGETGIRKMNNSAILQTWLLFLPPYLVTDFDADYDVDVPMSIFAASPHSHNVCRKIINYAYKGNDTIPLIRINEWDFHWQGAYFYKSPLKIESGYKLYSEHVFDNTSNNPKNPNNPPSLVIAGTSTGSEMLYDSYVWMDYVAGDENLDLVSLFANDPLITGVTGLTESNNTGINKTSVYPNPFNERVTIGYQLENNSTVSISVYDIHGALVKHIATKNEVSGSHFVEWDGKNNKGEKVSSGVYYYSVSVGENTESGKIVLLPR